MANRLEDHSEPSLIRYILAVQTMAHIKYKNKLNCDKLQALLELEEGQTFAKNYFNTKLFSNYNFFVILAKCCVKRALKNGNCCCHKIICLKRYLDFRPLSELLKIGIQYYYRYSQNVCIF